MSDTLSERLASFRAEVLPIFSECSGYPVAVDFTTWLETELPEMITFGDVGPAIGRTVSDSDEIWTIAIMSQTLFEPEMHFKDDDGSMIVLSKGMGSKMMAGEPIPHPRTGEMLADATTRTYPRFRLRDPSPEQEPAAPSF